MFLARGSHTLEVIVGSLIAAEGEVAFKEYEAGSEF
jgi:hypothetical protein